jgi:hypothetical protein
VIEERIERATRFHIRVEIHPSETSEDGESSNVAYDGWIDRSAQKASDLPIGLGIRQFVQSGFVPEENAEERVLRCPAIDPSGD